MFSLTSSNQNHPKMFITNHQKPLQMKQEKNDKMLSRVLSRESSMANPSFRVYYGGLHANVPFMWESQPGTPKHNFKDDTLPPLTPPPSYFSNNQNTKPIKTNHSRSNLLRFLLLKLSLKRKHVPQSPSPTSSSSSFSSLFSTKSDLSMREPMTSCRSRFSSASSSFDSRGDYDEEGIVVGSPTSTLCFGIRRKTRAAKRVDGHRF